MPSSEIDSKILINQSKPQQTSPNRLQQADSNKKKQSQRSPLPPITTSPTKSSSSARAINLSKTRSRLRTREPGRGERVEWEKERARVPSNDSASRHVSRYASYGNVSAGSWPNVEKKGYGARARWLAWPRWNKDVPAGGLRELKQTRKTREEGQGARERSVLRARHGPT